jgi:hypothetical protein
VSGLTFFSSTALVVPAVLMTVCRTTASVRGLTSLPRHCHVAVILV